MVILTWNKKTIREVQVWAILQYLVRQPVLFAVDAGTLGILVFLIAVTFRVGFLIIMGFALFCHWVNLNIILQFNFPP